MGADLKALNFCVGSTAFPLSGYSTSSVVWPNANLGWSVGDKADLSIRSACHPHGPPPGKPTLTLVENQTATTLSFTIPCVSPGRSAVTDYMLWAENQTDNSVLQPMQFFTAPSPCRTITATLTDLEGGTTYRVRANARNLRARTSPWSDWVEGTTLAMQVGGGSDPPTVSLSAAPNPVPEGSAVRVTATLSSALSSEVTIPLTVTRDSSEASDHGTLAGITIPANGLSATGTIATTDDDEEEDERFTVSLGTLPSGVAAGATTSVVVTITDDDESQGQTGGTGTLMERCASYLPSNAVSVAEVEGWRDAHAQDAAHVLRWNRVLKALGEDVGAGVSPMTAAEAEANESLYIGTRWTRVKATLEALAACLAASTNGFTHTQNAPAPVPTLPVVAQLLLAALLGGGGYRRYLRHR